MVPIIKIQRYWQDHNQTLGNCTVLGDNEIVLYSGLSLERGWRNNQQGISCVPKTTAPYAVELEFSNRFKKDLWEIKGVPNRSECKFHAANYWHQLNGCVALGMALADINKDGYLDVTSSGLSMKAFHKALEGHKKAILIITGKQGIW